MQVENTQQAQSFRLSPQQEHIWMLGPEQTGYRAQCAVVVSSDIDEGKVRSALMRVVQRHEILRTTFARQAGVRVPSQVVNDDLEASWETEDRPGILDDSAALDEALDREAGFRFDLEQGPVLRVAMISAGDDRLIILTAPSVCADAASLRVVAGELIALAGGSDAATLPEPLQYADYAEWRNELMTGDDAEAQAGRAYWEELLAADQRAPRLLFGGTADPTVDFAPTRMRVGLDADLASRAAGQGKSISSTLEAAWHALLARISGEVDLVVASVVDARTHAELEGAVGPFEQALPILTRIDEETSFAEVVDQVRRARENAERWQDFHTVAGLGVVAERLAIGFAFGDAVAGAEQAATIRALSAHLNRFALELRCLVTDSGIEAEIRYDPTAYSDEDAERLSTGFKAVLATALADPTTAVDRLPLLDNEARTQVLALASGTRSSVADSCIHYLIEDQAARASERPAVVGPDGRLTYGELNAWSNRIAHFLRRRGIERGSSVGLCMDRSVEMIAALLGILKSGAAYVPLNFEHPAARLSVQLREAGAALVVTQEKLVDQLDGVEGDLVLVERARSELQTESDENPARTNEPGDDVYVMYTSGSTGVPKGIAVTHTNLVNYVAYMVQRLDARDALQFATVTAISTDLGNTSVFPSLASGGCLHLIDPESAMDSSRFAEYVRLNAVDVLKITPSHLAALVTGGDGAAVLPRRWLVIGGEAASWELTTRIRELGDCKILNHYGPTETTVGSCTFDLETDVSAWRPATLPIGRPIANSFAYILDRILEPVPVGVEGELCIGGAGVARGYVGRPDLTAELFVPDPFADGERMYRTGDRARYLPDGNIEFLGRKDQQVKIRGFRIELGEIEQALGAHPKIRQAAVVAQQHAAGDPRLVGYLVTEDEPDVEELQGFLGRTLPDYMIPATFVRIDAMPFTPSGKVDRRALPDPSRYEVETRARYVAPRTPLEEGLADIWAEVLGVERVGVDDDFFALGGHSLLATQVIARVRSTYSVDIPLHSLFLAPTVGGLAEAVVKLQGNGGPDEAELAQILSELEGLSEEDAQQLLTTDRDQRDDG